MATRQSDVTLLIRAKDEASAALSTINGAMDRLLGTQSSLGSSAEKTGSNVADLLKTLGGLDKAAGNVAASYGKAEAAFDRQAASIAANREQLANLQQQTDHAAGGFDKLRVAIVDAALAGKDTSELVAALARLGQEQALLEGRSAKLVATIEKQSAAFEAGRAPLQQVGSTLLAIGDAQEKARRQIDDTTAAMSRQQAASAKAAGVAPTINAAAGVSQPAALTAGAGFGALAAREDAAAIREAATAYNLFEARVHAGVAAMKEADAAEMQLNADAQADARKQATAAWQLFEEKVRSGVAAMKDAEATERSDAAAVAGLRSALDPVAAIYERMNTQLERYRALQVAGKLTSVEFAAAQKHLGEEATAAVAALSNHDKNAPQISLLGLAPYQTQNLLYQINDVITQLASGTSLTQTLGQQGGQIFQLFQNRIGPAIVGALTNPAVLLGIAGFAALAVALKESADQSERLRDFQGALATNADGGQYDPAKLAASAQGLTKLGASSADASTALKTFISAGVAPERLDDFGRTAVDLAETMGIKVPDAAKKLTDGFMGGYTAVAKLNDETNFLTASQREHIKTLYEEGDAQSARTLAFGIFAAQQADAAEKMRGPWSDAARTLGGAWKDMLAAFGNNSVISGAVKDLGELAENASKAINSLTNASKISELNATIASLRDARAATTDPTAAADITKLISKNRHERDALVNGTAPPAGDGDIQAGGSQRQLNANKAVQAATDAVLRTTRQLTAEVRIQAAIKTAAAEAAVALSGGELQSADKATQQAFIAAKVQKARLDTQKQIDDEAKAAAADRAQAIAQFESRVVGAEGGTAKNPFSSAKGFGQFTEGTYKQYFKQAYGNTGQSDDQILATRDNETIAKGVLDAFTKANANALESFGAKVTAGNLYLAHFLGATGAKAILNAPQDTPVDRLVSASVLKGNQQYLRTDNGKGRYKTAGELETFVGNRVGDGGAAQSLGQATIGKLQDDAAKKQEEFNLAITQQNIDRGQIVDSLTKENGLRDEALIAAQRQAAIEKAIVDLRQKAVDANKNLEKSQAPVVITDEQIKAVSDAAAAQFDAQNRKNVAGAQRNEVDQPVSDLGAQRAAIIAQQGALQAQGEIGLSDQLKPQLAAVTAQFQEAIAASKAFYDSLAGLDDQQLAARGYSLTAAQVENIRLGLDTAKTSAVDLGSYLGIQFSDVAQKFASGAAGAFDTFAHAVGDGKNAFHSAEQAFLQFASSFILQIAQMIEQQIIFNAISGFLKTLSLGAGGFDASIGGDIGTTNSLLAASNSGGSASLIGGFVHHSGGIAGEGGARRAVAPEWFATAARYHTGGIAGLSADEIPTILQRGEEVLTASDVRHRFNAPGPANDQRSADSPIRVIASYDPADAMEKALRSPAGEKVFIAHMADNATAINAVLGR